MRALSAIISVLTAAGCANQRVPPPGPPKPALQTPPADSSLNSKSPSRSVVRIADEIRQACGISDVDAHFAFDSSRVSSAEYPTLDKLVTCFASGPLAKRQMRLVGHADPRGNDEYNLVLGGQRADGVKAVLVERGLSVNQAATTSRGEWDAKGTNEASWAEDRRVDIQLAN